MKNLVRDPPTVRVIARNLAVFSNVTLTKHLYGIRKSGHFTYSWYNNYYSRSCVFFIADMLQILAAVKTSRPPGVVKIWEIQYIFFYFFSLLFCMAERGNAEDWRDGEEGTWQADACSSARITRTISTGRSGQTELWSALVRAGSRACSSSSRAQHHSGISVPHELARCVSIWMVFFGGPAVYALIDNMALLMAICYC